MAKKKGNAQVINNIGEVHLDIDYDKLAEAIVKAQERAKVEQNHQEEVQVTPTQKKKWSWKSFFRNLWSFICNKTPSTQDEIAISLSAILNASFKAVSALCFLLFVISIPHSCFSLFQIHWSISVDGIINEMQGLITAVLTPILLFAFALEFWAIGNAMSREKDKGFLLTMFSSIVGIVALVVSIVK